MCNTLLTALINSLTAERCAALLAYLPAIPLPPLENTVASFVSSIIGRDASKTFFEKCLCGPDQPLKLVGEIGKRFKLSKSADAKEYFKVFQETKERLYELLGDHIETIPIYEYPPLQVWGTLEGSQGICELKVMDAAETAADWQKIIIEIYALAAIAEKKVGVVAHPLLSPILTVVSTDADNWSTQSKEKFLETLRGFGGCTHGDIPETGEGVMKAYNVGVHLGRDGKTVAGTIQQLTGPQIPAQIFISAPMMSAVRVNAADIAAARAHVDATGARVFVHAPYLINLAATPGEKDDYGVVCLEDTVKAAVAAGFKGVVVHVGKSVKLPVPTAISNMRTNLLRAIKSATPECPILLETPAGQGTELLRIWSDFFGFVRGFEGDLRLRVCIDTCHVFAAGEDPVAYVDRAIRECAGMVHLIHFNDSKGAAGSCVDRHAFIGEGNIGIEKMSHIGSAAMSAGIPCVYE
jgi:deoxyribonuclease-4